MWQLASTWIGRLTHHNFFELSCADFKRLSRETAENSWFHPIFYGVEPLTRADRICAVAAAAAHDLNDELTVILSSVTSSIRAVEHDHPAHLMLLDLQSAAQRCAWKASGLLNFTARSGARASAATLERLIEEQR